MRKAQGRAGVLMVLIVSALLISLVLLPQISHITGFAAAGQENKIVIEKNKITAINMSSYVAGVERTYLATSPSSLDVQVKGNLLVLTPDKGFTGERVVKVFVAGQEIQELVFRIDVVDRTGTILDKIQKEQEQLKDDFKWPEEVIAGEEPEIVPEPVPDDVLPEDVLFVSSGNEIIVSLDSYFSSDGPFVTTGGLGLIVNFDDGFMSVRPYPGFVGEQELTVSSVGDLLEEHSFLVQVLGEGELLKKDKEKPKEEVEKPEELESVSVKDEIIVGSKKFGEKIEDDAGFDVFFKSIVQDNETLRIVFYHDSNKSEMVYVGGDVNYTLSANVSDAFEDVNLTVVLDDSIVPEFELHVGDASEKFKFGKKIPAVFLDGRPVKKVKKNEKAKKDNDSWYTVIDRDDGLVDVLISKDGASVYIKGVSAENITGLFDWVEGTVLTTEIFAAEPIEMEEAVITLPRTDEVTAVVECKEFDFAEKACSGDWTVTRLPFIKTDKNVTFTVYHFSGYGGGNIAVINVQSYPTLYGNWTVMFNTTGTADLAITGINTTWTDYADSGYDLKFLEVRCGNQLLNYSWVNGSVFIPDYQCDALGYETSKVLTTGKHVLEFRFGDDVDYAFNQVNYTGKPVLNSTYGTNKTSENLTIYPPANTGGNITNITQWFKEGSDYAVLNMPFDTNVSSLAAGAIRDYSTYANNGTLGAGFASWAPVWTNAGISGGAYVHDGLDDMILVVDSDYVSLSSPIALEAWINARPDSGYKNFFEKQGEYLFRIDNSGEGSRLSCFIVLNSSYEPRVSSTAAFPTGAWHHVVCVWDGARIRLYIDGVLNNSVARTGTVAVTSYNLSLGRTFNGTLDEVRIYKQNLSAQQILAHYNSGAPNYRTIVSQETDKGEVWHAELTPNDGIADGISRMSNSLQVSSAPTQDIPVLNSSGGLNFTYDNITVYPQNVQDIDGDAVYNITNWFLNGSSITVLNMPFEGLRAMHSVADSSTVLAMYFENNTKDFSGLGNDGNCTNCPAYTSSGQVGGAYVFDGDDDYIGVGVMPNMTSWTISAWVNPNVVDVTATPVDRFIVFTNDKAGWNDDVLFGICPETTLFSPNKRFAVIHQDDNASLRTVAADTVDAVVGSWYHVVAVADGSTLKLYVNGVQKASTNKAGADLDFNGAKSYIGENHGNAGVGDFNGTIDEVHIFNRTLSSTEVLALYKKGLDSSKDVIDYSSYMNKGDVSGAAWTTSGKSGGAYNFPTWSQIIVPNDSSLEGMSELTIMYWRKATGGTPLDVYKANTYYSYCPGQCQLVVYTTAGNLGQYSVTGTFNDDSWHLFAGTWKSTSAGGDGKVRIYYDGSLDVTSAGTLGGTINTTGNTLYIGGPLNPWWTNGTLDEIRIFNRSLSSEQIAAIYNAGTPDYNTIVSQETQIGDVWGAVLTPNDGIMDGETKQSNNITIRSTAPAQDTPVLNTSTGYNATNEDLNVWPINVQSPINLSVKNITNWYLNGTSIMVLNMPFEGGSTSGTGIANGTTKDYSGFNNHGTVVNATWSNSSGFDNWGYYDFAGNAYINAGNSSVLDIEQDLSIAAWVKLNSLTGGKQVLVKKADEAFFPANTPYEFYVNNDNLTFVYTGLNLGGGSVTAANQFTNTSKWYFVVAARKVVGNKIAANSTMSLYVDGQLVASSTGTNFAKTTNAYAGIGGYSVSAVPGYLNGSLDEVQIYNRTLTAQQINSMYSAGLGNYNVIKSQETRINDTWQACLTPNDRMFDGDTNCSNNLTIKALPVCGDTLTSDTTIMQNYNCNGTAFTMGADNITINCAGHRIKGNGTGYGFYANLRSNTIIENCIIEEFGRGIMHTGGSSNIMRNNTLINNTFYSIEIASSHSRIHNNTFYNHTFGSSKGILAKNLNNITIEDNLFTQPAIIATTNGISLSHCSNSTVRNNILMNSDGGIVVDSSPNVIISGNNCTNFLGGDAIRVQLSVNALIENNYMNAGGGDNPLVVYSQNATVRNNRIHNSSDIGIELGVAEGSRVYNNTVVIGAGYGIRSHGVTQRVDIYDNNITGGVYGIFLATFGGKGSNYTYAENNTISGTGGGIYLAAGSNHNTFRNNRLLCSGTQIGFFGGFDNSIIDTKVDAYYFLNSSYTSIENTSTGKIKFLSNISAIGASLFGSPSSDIRIKTGNVFVNSSAKPGLNVSANITLYGITIPSPRIYADRNDDGIYESRCMPPICYNLSYSGGTFVFNSTHFTFYNINSTMPPTHDPPILNSTFGTNYTYENLTVWPQNVTDIDGDKVVNITNWYVNNKSITVLNMPFDLNNNTFAKDYSPYGNNGTLGGGTAWTNAGISGGAYNFVAVNMAEMQVNDSASLDLAGSFAVEVWVNASTIAASTILSKSNSTAENYQFDVYPNGSVSFRMLKPGFPAVEAKSITLMVPGNWYHIVGVYDQNTTNISIYVNGVKESEVAGYADISGCINNRDITIGAYGSEFGTSLWFDGIIDEVRIYNRSLSAQQIASNYNGGTPDYNTIVSEETRVGDIWRACVVVSDGMGDSVEKCSNNLTIRSAGAMNTSLLGVKFNVSDFSFASTAYVTGVLEYFNTSAANTSLVLMSSMNVKKLGAFGVQSNVYARVKVDGNIVLEDLIRSVQGMDEGSTGTKPVAFSVGPGSHNITFEFRRTGTGSIEVNDIDILLGQLRTAAGQPVRGQLLNGTYSHSSNAFVPAFNWTISKTVNSSTVLVVKQTVNASTTSIADYYFEDLLTGDVSPYWGRWLQSVNDVGAVSGNFIEETETLSHNHTIQSRASAGTVTVKYSLIDFDLRDSNSNLINSFSATNNQTNLTSTKNYGAGTHNIANKTVTLRAGSGYAIFMTSSFTTSSGSQTPVYFINSTQIPKAHCYSKKERYLSSNADIGNAFIYTICDNLTVGQNYTFNLWVTVAAGETVVQRDESLSGFEVIPFDISKGNLPPLPNTITNPLDNSTICSEDNNFNITWLAFSDFNGDVVTYNVSLRNPDGSYNSTINASTLNTWALWDNTVVPDGNWIIMVKGCDPLGLCSNSTSNFTKAPLTINTTQPDIHVLNFRLDSQIYNASFNTLTGNCTNCSFDAENTCQVETEVINGSAGPYNMTLDLSGVPINMQNIELVCTMYDYAVNVLGGSNCSGSADTSYACANFVGGNLTRIDLSNASNFNGSVFLGTITPVNNCTTVVCYLNGTWEPGDDQSFSVNKTFTCDDGFCNATNPNGTLTFTVDKYAGIKTMHPDISVLNLKLDFQEFNGSFGTGDGLCFGCIYDLGNGTCQAEVEKVFGMFQSYNVSMAIETASVINMTALSLVCRTANDTVQLYPGCSNLFSPYGSGQPGCMNWVATPGRSTVVGGNALVIDLANFTNITIPLGTISPAQNCNMFACEINGTWSPGNTQSFVINKTITVTAV